MKNGAASTASIPHTQIQGNLAEINSGDTATTRTIDEAQHNVSPLPIIPLSAKEELNKTTEFSINDNGDGWALYNVSLAFQNPEYAETFQTKMKNQVQGMISYSKSNSIEQPKISLANVDYNPFGLNSKKEFFSVDANTLHAYKTSDAIRNAGITVLGKPVPGTHSFELVAFKPSGEQYSGADWNDFFDKYDGIVSEEQQQVAG
ncbi:hypothetical protein IKJ53_01770 [bacterium]|nr:hypothetical protein [bacterium]